MLFLHVRVGVLNLTQGIQMGEKMRVLHIQDVFQRGILIGHLAVDVGQRLLAGEGTQFGGIHVFFDDIANQTFSIRAIYNGVTVGKIERCGITFEDGVGK